MLQHHPDVKSNDPMANARFIRIQVGARVVSNARRHMQAQSAAAWQVALLYHGQALAGLMACSHSQPLPCALPSPPPRAGGVRADHGQAVGQGPGGRPRQPLILELPRLVRRRPAMPDPQPWCWAGCAAACTDAGRLRRGIARDADSPRACTAATHQQRWRPPAAGTGPSPPSAAPRHAGLLAPRVAQSQRPTASSGAPRWRACDRRQPPSAAAGGQLTRLLMGRPAAAGLVPRGLQAGLQARSARAVTASSSRPRRRRA